MAHFKKLISLLLTVTLTLFSTACGKTGDAANKSTDDSFSNYAGVWSESDLSWDLGGITLEISTKNEELSFDCRLTQGAPQSRVAQFIQTVKPGEIKNNSIVVNYEDDSWGNSGSVEFTFGKNYILADFKEVVPEDGIPVFGFYVSTYKLVRNDNAYKLLEYNMDDYEQKYSEDDMVFYEPSNQGTVTQPMYTFPTTNTTSPPKPSYDISKASGILANMGMTEEEFKKTCTPLSDRYFFDYDDFNSTKVYMPEFYHLNEGKKYFSQNPNDNAVELATYKWNAICEDYKSGGAKYQESWSSGMTWGSYHLYEKYRTLENYLNDVVYASKGADIICEYTENLIEEILEFPDKHIGKPFVLLGFDVKFDLGEAYGDDDYMNKYFKIQDLRDDPNNPNILSKYDYTFYVIFDGLSSGYQFNFSLIAFEKTERWQAITE